MIRILLLASLCLIVSCGKEGRVNKFEDANLVTIADFQDRRQSESLYPFFEHENPEYRRDAVLAFASIQDTVAIPRLAKVLTSDARKTVRVAAAFALGQTGTLKSFDALIDALNKEKEDEVIREIVHACGKTAPKEGVAKILALEGNNKTNEGFAWCYYRLGVRGLADSLVVQKAIALLGAENTSTRAGAAYFFSRGPKNIASAETVLTEKALNDESESVRMAATSALRKIQTPSSLETIKKIISSDKDHRVRVNAVRALQPFPLKDSKQSLIAALNDSMENVAIASAEVLKSVATKDEVQELAMLARAAKNWRVQGNLFEAAVAGSNSQEIVNAICKLYPELQNPYAKAALLSALGQSTLAYNFVNEQLHQSQIPVIKSTAAGALVSINGHKEFTPAMQKDFADIYKKAFETGDAAVMGTIAGALADSTLGYKKIITDYTFLYEAKKKLSLPKDNEALQPLEAAIAHFEGKKLSNEVKNEFNHPIDWELVKTIPANQHVLIKTAKGDVLMQLLVEETPGSVANFVQLLKSGYFDNKNFHRVVPNFVIQGGCNRGDGWGSEDYSIRSEFSLRPYVKGSVGMASAGKDTEGTQWFITHSPTPHLDGKYSLFAVVLNGFEVVDQIEVGDQILNVELTN